MQILKNNYKIDTFIILGNNIIGKQRLWNFFVYIHYYGLKRKKKFITLTYSLHSNYLNESYNNNPKNKKFFKSLNTAIKYEYDVDSGVLKKIN